MTDDSLIGERLIARYRIDRVIGRGDEKTTYEAYDVISGETRVIKSLPVLKDTGAGGLFGRKRDILHGLDHPSVPRVHADFVDDAGGEKRNYVVVDRVEGQTLESWASQGGRLDDASARALLGEMLEVLRFLHTQSPPILHLDIKPSNIMRLESGKHVLFDFDVARGLSSGSTNEDGTRDGFAPLEQLEGQATPASDIYALGMTVVALLSGRKPAHFPVQRQRVRFEDYIDVSDELVRVLAKMAEPAVADRFTSADEVIDALENGLPEPTPQPPPETKAERRARREAERKASQSAQLRAEQNQHVDAAEFFRNQISHSATGDSDVQFGSSVLFNTSVEFGTPVQPADANPIRKEVQSRGGDAFAAFAARESRVIEERATDVPPRSRNAPRATKAQKLAPKPAYESGVPDVGIEHVPASDWTEDDIGDARVIWATNGRASSTYGTGWTADRASGPPDVFPRHGDHVGAWAPDACSDGAEWLELDFPPNSPRATEIRVFETLDPGAIIRVEERSNGREVLWEGDALYQPGQTAKVFRIRFAQPRKIRTLRLVLDTAVSESWNEIDAVAIVGTKPFLDNLPTQPKRGKPARSGIMPGSSLVRAPRPQNVQVQRSPRPHGAPQRHTTKKSSRSLPAVMAAAGVVFMVSTALIGVLLSREPTPMQAENAVSAVTSIFPDMEVISSQGDKIGWGEAIIDFSTEWGSTEYSAAQVLGPPDVYPRTGEEAGAWAPTRMDGGREFLEVSLPDRDEPVVRVLVVETHNPGAVSAVHYRDRNYAWHPLWEGSTNDGETRARFLAFDLVSPTYMTGLRVELRTGRVAGWNEVDAIGAVYAR